MIFSYILIYELVFHTTPGLRSLARPPHLNVVTVQPAATLYKNIPPQFLSLLSLLSLQQFLVIEVSNNDSKGMWFSGSDARCFKSSAWFSRGHNFPYMCLPHFQDACIQVHIRKPSKTYIRNCYFHILPQCVTCFHIVHIFSICSFLYNPIPVYFKVFSCSQIYQTRNSGLGVLDLIIEYFNIFGVPL